jgi:2-polyprenyl-3-methyl-5-hydroxy-6-metoxy-1,4-benzoquinol methylase
MDDTINFGNCDMNPYNNYLTTSSLTKENDPQTIINWNNSYFKYQYLKLLPSDKNCRILDLGCGYGKNIIALKHLGYNNVVGVDFSEDQVLFAKTNLGLKNVLHSEALEWLEGNGALFDCILAIDILEHLDTDTLLNFGKSINKNLKRGGHLIIQVPNGRSPLNHIPSGDITHLRAFTPQSINQFFLLSSLSPCGFYEAAPHIHGFLSLIRRIIWSLCIKPALSFISMVMNGPVFFGNIFTANIISVAKKDS